MISESERRVRILDYVRQNSDNPKVTKSDVMRHMKEYSRAMTTHKTTIDLIKEGKIKMEKPKDKPYSQIDYLIINEENEFNKIYESLSEIENIMDIIHEPIRKRRSDPDQSKHDVDLVNAVHRIVEKVQGTFEEAIPILIQELLTRTNNKMQSDIDKEILNLRILRLQQKIIDQMDIREHTTLEKLGFYIARLQHVYSNSPFLTRVKKIEPNFLYDSESVAQKFEKVLINFKNRFFSDEQKTKDPHEK